MTGTNLSFELHEIVSKILTDKVFLTDQEYQKIKDKFFPRVTQCNKIPLMLGNTTNHVSSVEVRKNSKHGNAYFHGLMKCGSVWACPICAPRIAEQRTKEIAMAFQRWQEMGTTFDNVHNKWRELGNTDHTQVMVTFTIPHVYKQSLKELRDTFMLAKRNLKGQQPLRKQPNLKVYTQLKDEYGIRGTLTAIEVTFGFNGWHNHSHDIFFLDKNITDSQIAEFKTRLTSAWVYACKRSKVKMTKKQEKWMYERSIDLRRAKTAEEYISKFGFSDYENHKDILNPGWGAAQELSKSHVKVSRGEKGFTPWDLLRIIHANPGDRKTYLKYGRLFYEYYTVFKRKTQIFWSKGFKEELELTDYILSDLVEIRQNMRLGCMLN